MSDQPLQSPTILVVEDVAVVRQMLVRALLEEGGYRVMQAGDGVEALAIRKADPTIDLVVTDIAMPNLGGLGLAAHVTLIARPPVFLFITGYDQNPSEVPGVLLTKPFAPPILLAEVRRLLATTAPSDRA
jgi:CheY-like chemotaxis protein